MINIGKLKEKNMLLCKKALHFFRDDKKPSIVEWIVIGLITFLIFFSFIYADIYAWTVWSVTFWDSLFDGRVLEYYKYCYDNVYGLNNVFNGSDLLSIIILAVWNFPIYFLKQFFGINILYSIPALLWSKALYLFTEIICMRLVYKIALKLKLSRVNALWAVFAFCASSVLLFGTYIDCQTDIICMPFYLAGFLLLLNGKKKSSALLFAVSIAIKPFPLIIFIPLILMAEKNPIKIILYGLEALSILLILKFISGYLPFYELSVKDINELYLKNFFPISLNIGMGEVALFPLAYVILCVYAYIYKPENDEYKNRCLLYLAFSALIVYFAFAQFEYYRIVLIAPFGALLIMQNVKQNRLLGICFAVFMLTFLITGLYKNPLVFEVHSESTLEKMLLSRIFGSTRFLGRKYLTSSDVIKQYLKIFINGVIGVYLAMAALILFFAHPKHFVDDHFVVAKEIIWLQIMPILITIFVICKAYFTLV